MNPTDGRLMAKILTKNNLVPNPSETWEGKTNLPKLSLLNIFAISLPLLGCHLRFQIFFHNSLL